MGREIQKITVQVRLGRHNSDEDEEHNALWEAIQMEIATVLSQEKFSVICPMILK